MTKKIHPIKWPETLIKKTGQPITENSKYWAMTRNTDAMLRRSGRKKVYRLSNGLYLWRR